MPGDMGHGCGKALLDHGFNVFTCLSNRSERTKSLAKKSGIKDTDDIKDLLNGLKLVGDFMDKTILKPNNVNYPISRNQFINSLK